MRRRDFLRALAASAAGATAAGATAAGAQGTGSTDDAPQRGPIGATNVPMDEGAYRPTRLLPKPGASPSMTREEQDAFEHGLRCQCGCTLDIYTCRTTDFSCQVSPALHRDITAMVEGGHTAEEIVEAMVGAYGERVLMAPTSEGFNLAGWVAPFAALGAGFVVLTMLLRRWKARAAAVAAAAPARAPAAIDASREELDRLERAVRGDGA
jgi:cytochrome c-type biogenesis protein CcmH